MCSNHNTRHSLYLIFFEGVIDTNRRTDAPVGTEFLTGVLDIPLGTHFRGLFRGGMLVPEYVNKHDRKQNQV